MLKRMKIKMISLTVTNKSNTWFVGKFLITKRAIWIIITILKPLKITLNYALKNRNRFHYKCNSETQDDIIAYFRMLLDHTVFTNVDSMLKTKLICHSSLWTFTKSHFKG